MISSRENSLDCHIGHNLVWGSFRPQCPSTVEFGQYPSKSIDVTEMFFPVAVLHGTNLLAIISAYIRICSCRLRMRIIKTEVEAEWKWKLDRSGSWMEVEVGWKWKHEGKSQWMAPTCHHKYIPDEKLMINK